MLTLHRYKGMVLLFAVCSFINEMIMYMHRTKSRGHSPPYNARLSSKNMMLCMQNTQISNEISVSDDKNLNKNK